MANDTVKNKNEVAEKAIARLFAQMDKEVNKRRWTAATYASLICYLVEACGGSFPVKPANEKGKPVAREAFRELMKDSDFSFSSNFKKYAEKRGLLPKAAEYDEKELD